MTGQKSCIGNHYHPQHSGAATATRPSAALAICPGRAYYLPMKNPLFISASIVMLVLFAGHAYPQTYYQCKDASGNVRFSDRVCTAKTKPITIEPSTGVVTPERKAESDARIQSNNALASQVEAQRRAAAQAAASAQGQQVQSAKGIESTMDQERAKKASAASSVIPSGGTIFTPPGQ